MTDHDGNNDDEIGTVRWFGPTWNAPVNDPRTKIPTPENERCVYCREEFGDDERGVRFPGVGLGRPFFYAHADCFHADMVRPNWSVGG